MKITAIIEKEDGTFEYTAELSQMQHQFLLEYAIRDLISKGLIPFHTPEGQQDSNVLIVSPIYDKDEPKH